MNYCQVNCSHSVGPAVIFTSISRWDGTGDGKCQCVILLDERLVLFSCCSALWWDTGIRTVWTQRHSTTKTHQHKHDSYLTLKSPLHTLGVNGKEVHTQITTLPSNLFLSEDRADLRPDGVGNSSKIFWILSRVSSHICQESTNHACFQPPKYFQSSQNSMYDYVRPN